MAPRAQPVTRALAGLAAALVLALTLGTLAAVAWRAEGFSAIGPAAHDVATAPDRASGNKGFRYVPKFLAPGE